MPRLTCLQDFLAAGADTMVECKGCKRRVRMDTRKLMARISNVQWWQWLEAQGRTLRCRECGHKGARLAPVPKLEKIAMDEWQVELGGPDSDGFAWLTVRHDGEETTLNLGPVDGAADAVANWLASIDYEERHEIG